MFIPKNDWLYISNNDTVTSLQRPDFTFQLFLTSSVNIGDLADIIISQNYIGNVLKVLIKLTVQQFLD